MTEQMLMKDRIDKAAIDHIAAALAQAMPSFDSKAFRKACLHSLQTLELKQRIHHIIHILHRFLPDDFNQTVLILHRVKHCWYNSNKSDKIHSFTAWPVIDYVGVYGIDHPQQALPLLKALTPLFSAEFAIRPFLLKHFDITYTFLQQWCADEDEHVRRLVSEGSRPRLPWGLRLPMLCQNPDPTLPLLVQLKNDPSLYVRKSVANHLNDISKDHPDKVIALCKTWQNQASAETLWIIRHASRSLIKAGHTEALCLLGYTPSPKVKVSDLSLTHSTLVLGDNLQCSFTVISDSKQAQKLVIDYAIHHIKANGKTTAKVFKLKSGTLDGKTSLTITKKHAFKPITTRRYYSGMHSIEILVNGISMGKADFSLTV